MKTGNIIFSLCCLLVFSLSIGYKIADTLGVLPYALNNEHVAYLEGRELEGFPALYPAALLDKSFQEKMETHLSDSFPARETAVVANASLERLEIEMANLPFSYDAYHTYLSSKIVYSNTYHALFEVPYKVSEYEELYDRSVAALAEIVAENPECRYLYYLPERSLISNSNPSMPLVTNVVNHETLEYLFASRLPEEFVLIDHRMDDTGEYLSRFFSTDLHWQINEAYDAYVVISEALGNEPLPRGAELAYPELPFSGSISRDGLMLLANDYIVDYDMDYPDYQLLVDGEPGQREYKDDFASGELKESQYAYGGYSLYFGHQFAELIYTMPPEETNGKNLLIVADSFSNSMELMLASSYENTYILDPRFYGGSVSDYIGSHDIDDVVFIMGANTVVNRGVLEALEK